MEESDANDVEQSDLDAGLEDFLAQYPVDDEASSYLLKSPRAVQLRVIQDFRAKKEGESDYSALVISFTKKCRATEKSQAAQGGSSQEAEPAVEDELESFVMKYPMDEEAMSYLVKCSPDVQRQVIRKFRPSREGQDDYSALIISFTKKCKSGAGAASEALSQSRRPATIYAPSPSMRYAAPPAPMYYAPPPVHYGPPPGSLDADLDEFFRRYPTDDAAVEYLMSSPPHVQSQVLQGFKPKREGESDYSALVISFTKNCRAGRRSEVAVAPPPRFAAPPPVHMRASGPPRRTPDLRGDLHAFRRQFPMDDRAFAYLSDTPPAALQQVFQTFRPPRVDDTDYSAPVISYVKKCRQQMGSHAPPPVSTNGTPPWERPAPPWARAAGPDHGRYGPYGNGPAAYSPHISYAPVEYVSQYRPRSARQHNPVDGFAQRYPMDDRAFKYLTDSPPEVIDQVLHEFKPKREGEGDYSGAVVAFVKRCRDSGGAGMPAKRARLQYP